MQTSTNGSCTMRSAFEEKGLSNESINILLNSCSVSTKKQYESALRKWSLYCLGKDVNPCKTGISSVINFLTEKYNSGIGYSSLNTLRSAISLVLPTVEGFVVGAHPLITRFMKSVGRTRPPMRRYDVVWDAGSVIDLFKKWEFNQKLNVIELTYKVVGLLALLSGQRVQTIANIKLKDIHFDQNGNVNIPISNNIKTSGPGRNQPAIFLPGFRKNEKICPVLALKCYIEKTESLREKSEKLLISLDSKAKSVSTQTVSRWLKCLLEKAGIDTTIYKSHSVRHSSTSTALAAGVNIDTIFTRAGWTERSSVFARFYKCKLDERHRYANALLDR